MHDAAAALSAGVDPIRLLSLPVDDYEIVCAVVAKLADMRKG